MLVFSFAVLNFLGFDVIVWLVWFGLVWFGWLVGWSVGRSVGDLV
jgi:hypothetical protein